MGSETGPEHFPIMALYLLSGGLSEVDYNENSLIVGVEVRWTV